MTDLYYKGAQSTCAFSNETTWGTPGTVFRKFGIPTGTTDPKKSAVVKNLLDMNEQREGTKQTVTAKKYEIKYSFYVTDYFGLKAILGKVTKSGSSPTFSYKFTPSHDIPAFSFYHKIEKKDPKKIIREIYIVCKVKSANFSINEGLLMCDLTFSAKDRLEGQLEQAVTENTELPYKYADVINGRVQIDSKNIQMDEWSLSIDNKMIERQAGLLIDEQSVTNIEYNQTTQGQMDSLDVRNLIGGDEVQMSVKFLRGVNDSLEFLTTVLISEAPNPTEKGNVVTAEIKPMTRTLVIDYVTSTDIEETNIVL